MTCEQCYVCVQTVLQCSRTMLLAMTYDLCHGGHMVAEYPLLHTPRGDRHFHVFLVNMYCAGLCCPSALCMALHCFPITSNQAPVCVL